jgi:hypothetical protein
MESKLGRRCAIDRTLEMAQRRIPSSSRQRHITRQGVGIGVLGSDAERAFRDLHRPLRIPGP